MEHLIRTELIRFSRILLSYTKTVIGGMIVFFVVSFLWSGLSLFSQEVQVVAGISLFFLLLAFLITRLVPLSIPKKTVDENDWLLNELGLTTREVAELGGVGAFILALKNARSRTHNQPPEVALDFPVRVQITKKSAEGHNRVTKAFVLSKQDFEVFLDDISLLLTISLGKPDTPTPRSRLRPRTLGSYDLGRLYALVELPARLIEFSPGSPISLLLEDDILKSELCRWTIETASAMVEEIELTVGYQPSDKKEEITLDI